ncbi:MAG: hypothetical protein HY515_00520 [Candidatus Aenigmarchaeota archaeon]|nr:hypothetical protein [Candidatus Aenigmarchaeota archaeon]
MKTPVCSVCLQSNILCASCSKNVAVGKISGLGVDIIRHIYELSKSVKSLDKVEIEKIIDMESLVVIICKKNDVASLVGKNGRITNDLRKKFGRQIKVVGNDEHRTMISNLIFPARLDTIGKLYSAGSESLKIRLQKNQLRNLPGKKEDLVEIIEELTGMKAELSVQ